jgi:hypothetical protein
MSNKKSKDAEKPAELQELEDRVDVMMSTELSKKKPAKTSTAAKKTSSLRVVSDYDDSRKTAPELSPKLRKSIKADEAPAEQEPEEPAPAEPAETEAAGDSKTEPVSEETPPAEAEPQPAPDSLKPAQSILEDAETDKAVEDIVVHEGDTQLAVDDAIAKRRSAEAGTQNQRGVLVSIFTSYWTWIFIIGIAGVTWAWFH